jgi:quinoprotein glucose dehydrogenase
VQGIGGRPFREVLGPGDCCAADGSGKPFAPTNFKPSEGSVPQLSPADEARINAGLTVQGLPIYKPPYGQLSAINLDKGEIMWTVPAGDTPDNVRNHPLLRGMTIPKTGQPGVSGVGLMNTKTIVVMGDPQVTTTPEHPRGAMLRAYDKTSGREVGAVYMPAPQSGSPMTYMVDGKQFIVVAVSGGSYSGEFLAFSLPNQ